MEVKVLPKDTIVYRSYIDETKRNGRWFATDPAHTYYYGPKTASFRLLRDLRMIDIAHPHFYDTLKNILRAATEKDNVLRTIHPLMLFPLGFDDHELYKEMVNKLHIPIEHNPYDVFVHVESHMYFNNRSRLSIYQFDELLVKFLNDTLGDQCNGIISDKYFPNILCNSRHHPEICVFDASHVEYVGEYVRPVAGGADILTATDKISYQMMPEQAGPIVKQHADYAEKILNSIKPIKQNIKMNVTQLEVSSPMEGLIRAKGGHKKRKSKKTLKKRR